VDVSYREQALKLFPHVCGRCAREFEGKRLQELTVHHKDGNHDNNPPDGSNWELLCIYCHENEHARYEDSRAGAGAASDHVRVGSGPGFPVPGPDPAPSTHRPLAGLDALLKKKRSK
jgi:hypothetical protein